MFGCACSEACLLTLRGVPWPVCLSVLLSPHLCVRLTPSLPLCAVCLFFKYPLNLFMCRHVVNVLMDHRYQPRVSVTDARAQAEHGELANGLVTSDNPYADAEALIEKVRACACLCFVVFVVIVLRSLLSPNSICVVTLSSPLCSGQARSSCRR